MEKQELTHHGILGMKWGVRRYQNKDGTLTAKGKKRYSAEMEKLREEEKVLKNKQRTKAKVDKLLKKRQELDDLKRKMSGSDDSKIAKSSKDSLPNKPRSIKDMSDEELAAKINRMRLEQTYKSLSPKVETSGEKFVNKILKPAGENIAKKLGDTILDKVRKDMREKFGLDVGDKEMAALKKEADSLDLKKKIAESKTAIKKANGEKTDTEYDNLKRESEIAEFKKKIALSEKIQRENKTAAEVKVSDVPEEVADAGKEYIQMSIFDYLDD